MTLNDNRIQLCTREEGHIQNESEMTKKMHSTKTENKREQE
jgi:hypothetical protein